MQELTPELVLKNTFGYKEFRLEQKHIIDSIMSGTHTLGVMPTGGGKSLCYQIPALLFPGVTLVISPLISLMKDQVEQLAQVGIRSVMLNSSLDSETYRHNMGLLARGESKLLYLAPETLMQERMRNFLRSLTISQIAIDEAHCISEWGHDFRPEYRQIQDVQKEFPQAVTTALTATATPRVRQDIRKHLSINSQAEYLSSFDRKNLILEITPKESPKNQLIEFVKENSGKSGIVYCNSRKQVESLADSLRQIGFSSRPYHAGLSDEERHENQDLFIRDEIHIIVATIAFGMGINKPDVRWVLHYDLPKNMESYYQQIGRAGRDGLEAKVRLLFGYGDISKIKHFISQQIPSEQMHSLNQLETLIRFAETDACRRIHLLDYFGEKYPEESCGMCDNCLNSNNPLVDLTEVAQKFLSCVKRSGERFGPAHIIDILRGSENAKIKTLEHDQLSTYGIGKDRSKAEWTFLSHLLQQKGLLMQTEHKGLELTSLAWPILRGQERFMGKFSQVQNQKILKDKPKVIRANPSGVSAKLFDALRDLRTEIAREQSIPPYMVFGDKSLIDMCEIIPQNQEEFLQVHGVGENKLERYGDQFLQRIRENS